MGGLTPAERWSGLSFPDRLTLRDAEDAESSPKRGGSRTAEPPPYIVTVSSEQLSTGVSQFGRAMTPA